MAVGGYPLSYDQFTAASGIFLDEIARSDRDLSRLKYRLTPLFATSAHSQEAIADRIDAFAMELPVATDREREIQEAGDQRRRLTFTVLATMACVIIAAAVLLAGVKVEEHLPEEPAEPPEITGADVPADLPDAPQPIPLVEDVEIHPQTEILIRERNPHPWRRWVLTAAFLAPVLAALLWWWLRRRRRQFWLSLATRGVDDPDPRQAGIFATEGTPQTTALRGAGENLGAGAEEFTHGIDMNATVQETVRSLGDLRIVEERKRGYADYIVLIERKTANDHLAMIIDRILDRIDAAGINVKRYYYRNDPRYAQPDDATTEARSFEELANGFGHHRFIVIGSSDGFFHPVTGELNDWTEAYTTLVSRTLLNARSIGDWAYQEEDLRLAGFTIGEATPEGVASYSVAVSTGQDAAGVRLAEKPPAVLQPVADLGPSTEAGPKPIFVSYRRGDLEAVMNIRAMLAEHFGAEMVFVGHADVEPGADGSAEIVDAIAQCKVVLAVVGPRFLRRADRLSSSSDAVRAELAAAERLNKPIVPLVLAKSEDWPGAWRSQVPEPVGGFLRGVPVDLRNGFFRSDVELRLVPRLRHHLGDAAPRARRSLLRTRRNAERAWAPRRLAAPAAVVLLLFAAAALVSLWIEDLYFRPLPAPSEVATVTPDPEPFGRLPTDCAGCPTMIPLPGGTFLMGSPVDEEGRANDEGPQHEVTIARFALAKTEVTFDQWQACVDGGGCTSNPQPDDLGWGRGSRPVIDVSWEDAREYIVWLNAQVDGSDPYRLPTEAEWEYAARAGTATPFAFGDTISTDQANYDGRVTYGEGEVGEFRGRSVPVEDLRAANSWGLRHMHGNVWEWVADCWHDDFSGAPDDGSAWGEEAGGDCSLRVVRGGSWGDDPRHLRSAVRVRLVPGNRADYVGFRPARTLFTP